MSRLTAERVHEITCDCLFREDEAQGGEVPEGAVIVHGLVQDFGFHPQRLESHRVEITDMLFELPEAFQIKKGGGWSFLNMCDTAAGVPWGEHRDMEALFALAIGLKLAQFAPSRALWRNMPGGMPYVVLDLPEIRPQPPLPPLKGEPGFRQHFPAKQMNALVGVVPLTEFEKADLPIVSFTQTPEEPPTKPLKFDYRVVWNGGGPGWYATTLRSTGQPDDFARAWRDADYNGPYSTEREARESLGMEDA